ncbi:MAG: ribosome biogenesis GTPase Der, partial [Pseudomonadota bacterium]
MKPVIALVGRPNVGKSTLFNYLTKSNSALVADQPGLTRDRIYGITHRFDDRYIVIDTGGIAPPDDSKDQDKMNHAISQQAWLAIEEADLVCFLVDGTEGLVPQDQEVFSKLRTSNKKSIVLVNKADAGMENLLSSDFYALGAEHIYEISAKSGKGVRTLFEKLDEQYPVTVDETEENNRSNAIKVALVGRPNVGKSTLANALIGEERFVTSNIPGTTRDSISARIEKFGTEFELIDTAGVRRRSKVSDMVEKFSVVKTLQSIEDAHVVILMLDGTQEFAEQDARLAGLVLQSGRAVVVAINKTDISSNEDRNEIQKGFDLKLRFLEYAERHFISAKNKEGVTKILRAAVRAYKSSNIEVSTSEINRLLENALESFQPPLIRGRRIKLKYAAQVGANPPTIAIHGNQIGRIPGSYKRYLENYYRK